MAPWAIHPDGESVVLLIRSRFSPLLYGMRGTV